MFIALNVQYMTTKREYNQCAYEQDAAARELEKITKKIGQIEQAAGSSTEYKKTETYQKLQAYSTTYENRKDFLKTKMDLLKGQMEAFETGRNNNLKKDTSFWCWA